MPIDIKIPSAFTTDTPNKDLLLTEFQVQDRYGLKVGTLRAWRVRGTVKLPFVKLGSMIRYRLGDVEAFLADNVHFHTSEIQEAGE